MFGRAIEYIVYVRMIDRAFIAVEFSAVSYPPYEFLTLPFITIPFFFFWALAICTDGPVAVSFSESIPLMLPESHTVLMWVNEKLY